jgi:tetratricopeptide (TPR) repeat protein
MRAKTLAYPVAVALLAISTARADTSVPESAPPMDLVQKAEVLVARQSWPAAVEAYEKAIREQPKDAALRNRLGMCYQNAGDPKRAAKAYKTAIRLRKDYSEAWNNLGTLEHSRNRYEEAIAAYTKATAFNPASSVTYRNLGAAWAALGDLPKAFAAWSEAYRIDPTLLDGHGISVPAGGLTAARQYYLFAKLFAARGQTDQALEFLTKAQALGFQDFAQVEGDQDFAGLVADPRYAALK